jgi:hypothetical protein
MLLLDGSGTDGSVLLLHRTSSETRVNYGLTGTPLQR